MGTNSQSNQEDSPRSDNQDLKLSKQSSSEEPSWSNMLTSLGMMNSKMPPKLKSDYKKRKAMRLDVIEE